MADQFENQLPQKSDAKWVRALDASGNPILISKEDLASVVGGLLPLASDDKNGPISASEYRKLANISLSWGVAGSGKLSWIRICKFAYSLYNPLHITAFYGIYSQPKENYNVSLSFYNKGTIYQSGSFNNNIGVVYEEDGAVLYVKVPTTYCISACIIGGVQMDSNHSISESEPSGIIYI